MFETIASFFFTILYQPLFNGLVLLYNYIPGHDFGAAIIFLTLIIRLVLYPISVKAVNSQRSLQKLQPQMKEIQEKYKTDKEKQAKEVLDLYKKEKINPFSLLKRWEDRSDIKILMRESWPSGTSPRASRWRRRCGRSKKNTV